MNVADHAIHVDHAVHGHAAKLEQIDLLPVHFCDRVFRVGQTDKGDVLTLPIMLERLKRIGPHCKKLHAARLKPGIGIAKTRQLRAAVRSDEASQKGKQNGFVPAIVGKAHRVSVNIVQQKIWSWFA